MTSEGNEQVCRYITITTYRRHHLPHDRASPIDRIGSNRSPVVHTVVDFGHHIRSRWCVGKHGIAVDESHVPGSCRHPGGHNHIFGSRPRSQPLRALSFVAVQHIV